MEWREHVPLRETNPFHTGGVTEYYARCNSLIEIIESAKRATQRGLSYRVIGAGSSILMSDAGYPGLVIQNETQGMVFAHDRSQVIVESGFPVNQLVTRTVSQGYSGLEFLVDTPGTIGGAVYRNTVRFRAQLGQYVKSVTAYVPEGCAIAKEGVHRFDREWLAFQPNESRLKTTRAQDPQGVHPVILSVTLQLSKMDHATCLKKMHAYIRQLKTIPPRHIPALKVFHSLVLSDGPPPADRGGRHDVPLHFVSRSQVRQWRINEVSTYPDNPNYFIHTGMGTSHDAKALIERVQLAVGTAEHPLMPIIEYVGPWHEEPERMI